MRTAIITGANGFIGSRLVKELISQNIKVFAIDKPENNNHLPKCESVTFIPCDLKDISVLKYPFPNEGVDVLYHLAWQGVSPDTRDIFDLQYENVGYSIDCIRLAKRVHSKKVVLIGSTLEYSLNEDPIDENSRPTPINAYGTAKIATRYLAQQLCRLIGQPLVYAVFTSIYGLGREDNNVIFYTISSLLRGDKPLLTKLEQKADFISINDAARALYAIGEKGRPGSFYAVGNGDNLRLSEYIFAIRDMINPSLPLGIGAKPYNSSILPNSTVNPKRLFEETGFKTSISFQDGLQEMVTYYSKLKM